MKIKIHTIIAFVILFIFWFLFQIIMEELYFRVYEISTIGHIIVAISFSILCIIFFRQFYIAIKEEKTHKSCIRFGFAIFLMILFLMTIFDVYFGYFSKANAGAYYEPISWSEYFEKLPFLLCFSSIMGIFFYIFIHQHNKHEEKQKLKKKETEI